MHVVIVTVPWTEQLMRNAVTQLKNALTGNPVDVVVEETTVKDGDF